MCTDIESYPRGFNCGLHWLNHSRFNSCCKISLFGPGVFFDRNDFAPFFRNHAEATVKIDNFAGDGLTDALKYIRGHVKCPLSDLIQETTLLTTSSSIFDSLPRTLTLEVGSLDDATDLMHMAKFFNALLQRNPQASSPTRIYLEHTVEPGYSIELLTWKRVKHQFGAILTNARLDRLRSTHITLALG